MNTRVPTSIAGLTAVVAACLFSTATISQAADSPTFLKIGSIYRITPFDSAGHIPRVVKILENGGAGWFLVEYQQRVAGEPGDSQPPLLLTQRWLNFASVVTANEEKDWPAKKTGAAKNTDETARRVRVISGKDGRPAE